MPEFTFRSGAKAAAEAVRRPTCNPCREDDHGRCPTVLAKNDIIESTFDCACCFADEDKHDADFADRQEKRYEGSPWEDHGPMAGGYFHPETDYAPSRGYYSRMHREYQRWAGDD
jgi:hypothetical protein